MCALPAGKSPAQKNRAAIARAAAAAVLAALGGCASNQTANTQYSGSGVRVTQAVTDVEDDGLPAQTPPPPRIRQAADDPSEPFSRYYGGGNPSAANTPPPEERAPSRAPHPQIPSDLPPAFREKLAAAMDADE